MIVYPGGATIKFEMRAWRTHLGTDCSITYNHITNNTWMITVYFSELSASASGGSVGVGTTQPAGGAALEVYSDHQAFLPPRLTTAQRNNIADPVPGMMIFNTTTQKINVYTESGWGDLDGSSSPLNNLLGGTANEDAPIVYQTNDGGYIIGANTLSNNSGTLAGLTNFGDQDIWILKLDRDGDLEWQKLYGGSSSDYCYSIQQTMDEGFIVAGLTNSSNSGTLNGLMNNGISDGWIFKLDQSGNIIWQKLLGGQIKMVYIVFNRPMME